MKLSASLLLTSFVPLLSTFTVVNTHAAPMAIDSSSTLTFEKQFDNLIYQAEGSKDFRTWLKDLGKTDRKRYAIHSPNH
jgi:hypothetical protein